MKWLFKFISWLRGQNYTYTPKSVIMEQMLESRPLPMGRNEFMVWSDRIIAGALVPADPNQDSLVYIDSIRYALANMLLHLGPTESHKPDAYFIHSLRKFAINQVADTLRKELFDEGKKRVATQEAATQKPMERQDISDYKAMAEVAQVCEFHS